MLKKFTQAVTRVGAKTVSKVSNVRKSIAALSVAAVASAFAAAPMFAASDLTTVTSSLTDGTTEIKTNGMTIVVAVIAILIIFFGIGWLIMLWRKNMNKAS